MLAQELITTAYPDFDKEYDHPESYYLLRLSSLWGHEILTEYITAIEDELMTASEHINLKLNYTLGPIFP